MSQFTIYRSTDTSAPILNGITGSFVNLLDKCLITGYGSQIPAGWTKPFPNSGTTGCYLPASGSRFNLVVKDDSTTHSMMVGFEVLTNATTGTNQFGSYGLNANSANVHKSASADSISRDWILFADSFTFYFFNISTSLSNSYFGEMFGDFYSVGGTGDIYRCAVIGNSFTSTPTAATSMFDISSTFSDTILSHYTPRNSVGIYPGSPGLQLGKHGDAGKAGSTTLLTGSIAYPNPIDQGIYISPIWITEPTNLVIRGRLRGVYHMLHAPNSFYNQQVITATVGDFSGKSFMILKPTPNLGVYCIETSNTLDTNLT